MAYAERFYRTLLFCYPADFRREYATEMTQLFRERLEDEPRPLVWLDAITDLLTTAPKEHWHMLWNDIRYTARTLRKSPVFALAAILTVALAVGANTAIFSVVNTVLLRPLPFAEPDRLVWVAERNDKLNVKTFAASTLNYLSWKERTRSMEQLAAIAGASLNLTGRGDPEQFAGSAISPSLMPLLGLQPITGRAFRECEDSPAASPVAMISEGLWKRRFGGEPGLIGKTLTLNGIDYTVVGIAPAALAILTSGDIWIPHVIDPAHEVRLNHQITVVGRVRRGLTLAQAQAEMDTVASRVGRQYPEVRDWGIRLTDFQHWFVQDELRTALLVLLGAVGFVLLIACANVANLLLSRAASRQKEIALRTAMGASRGRLARQLLTESLALALPGGFAGCLIAIAAVRLMNAKLPPNLLPLPEIAVDASVLSFALGITILTGLLFGMAPAWHAVRADLNDVLKQGGRSSSGGVRRSLRNALVGGELALATVLLIGAGLMMQSVLRLQSVRLGFRPDHLLTFEVTLPPQKYDNITKSWGFYRTMLESLRSMPGVTSAAVSSGLPLGAGSYTQTPMITPGPSLLPPGTGLPIEWRIVSPGFFRTMEIPLLRGHEVNDHEAPGAPPGIVVSAETARRLWGTDDPLGKLLSRPADTKRFVVVGIVGGVRSTALATEPAPQMYYSAVSRIWPLMDVAVRTAGDPEQLLPAIRRKVSEIDPELPVSTVRTMDEWVSTNAAQPRLNAVLLAVFSGTALLIAAIGIYGVLAYSVNQQTRDIGVRMAVGAQRADILRMVVREGMVVALAGIAVGLVCALAFSRALASLVFGVEVRDPATFIATAAVLALVALAACTVPARRATLVDPVVALHDD